VGVEEFTVAHFIVVTTFGVWRRINFSQGLLMEGAAITLIGLFVVQAILAHPNRMYAMPVGGALLVLLGATLEFCCRSAVIFLAQIRTKEAVEGIEDRITRPSADIAKAQTRSIDRCIRPSQ
jgi:heme A synthase